MRAWGGSRQGFLSVLHGTRRPAGQKVGQPAIADICSGMERKKKTGSTVEAHRASSSRAVGGRTAEGSGPRQYNAPSGSMGRSLKPPLSPTGFSPDAVAPATLSEAIDGALSCSCCQSECCWTLLGCSRLCGTGTGLLASLRRTGVRCSQYWSRSLFWQRSSR